MRYDPNYMPDGPTNHNPNWEDRFPEEEVEDTRTPRCILCDREMPDGADWTMADGEFTCPSCDLQITVATVLEQLDIISEQVKMINAKLRRAWEAS